tara:strand:- start:944 stop:1120 length:177 start_codon:yes stop_codon:yes gene_type:complete
MPDKDDLYSDKETMKRRDQTIANMVNTPPRPKISLPPKKKTKTVSDRAAGKPRARREG